MSNTNLAVTNSRRQPLALGRADSSATASSYSHSSSSYTFKGGISSTATSPDMSPQLLGNFNPVAPLELKPTSGPPILVPIPPPDPTRVLSPTPNAQSDIISAVVEGPASWKLEFRGVTKLVRWMSSKGNTSPTPSSKPTNSRPLSDRAPNLLRRSTTRTSRFFSATAPKTKTPSTGTTSDPRLPVALSLIQALEATPPQIAPSSIIQAPPGVQATTSHRTLLSAISVSNGKAFANRDGAALGTPDLDPDNASVGDVVLNSDESLSQGNQTIRASDSNNVDTDAVDPDIGDVYEFDPMETCVSGTEAFHARRERRRRGLSKSGQSTPKNNISNPGEVVGCRTPNFLSSTTQSGVQSEDGQHLLPSLDSTRFSHSQAHLGSQGTQDGAVSSLEAREGRMTYEEEVGFTHAGHAIVFTYQDGDIPSYFPLPSQSTAVFDYDPSPSLDTTVVGHVQTISDVGHGGSASARNFYFNSSNNNALGGIFPGPIAHNQSARSPSRSGSFTTAMSRSGSVRRSNSSGSRKKKGISNVRRNSSMSATLKDKLKRSLPTRNSFLFPGGNSLSSKSKTDLSLAGATPPPSPPAKAARKPSVLEKGPPVIPEIFDQPPQSPSTTPQATSCDSPITAEEPGDDVSLPVSRLQQPSQSLSNFKAVSSPGGSRVSLPQTNHLSTATLPVALSRKPTESRRLTKKRGGSLGSQTDMGGGGSFMTNLAGAIAGLGLSTLSVDSQQPPTRGKLYKSSRHPPPAWPPHGVNSYSTSTSASMSPSPIFTSPPSPKTPLTIFTESPPTMSTPLAPSRRSSIGFFGSKRGSVSPRMGSGVAISNLPSREKLRKRRSGSGGSLGELPVPPVPPIPNTLVGRASSSTASIPRPKSQPPPSVVLTPPALDLAHARHPLTSLAYTGRYGYYAQEDTRRRLVERAEEEGGSPPMNVEPLVMSPPEDPENVSGSSSATSVQPESPSSPRFPSSIPASYLEVSPSSPVGFADQLQRRTSIYDPWPDGSEAENLLLPSRLARPTFPHRPLSNSAKRWTIAVNHIADDGDFLKEIDDLRQLKRSYSKTKSNEEVPTRDPIEGTDDAQDAPHEEGSDEEVVWMKARRAMLCVREIIRTEASYRKHLSNVWETESTSPSLSAPILLVSHLPILISASAALSLRLEEDPSAWGVSSAFLGVEDELEKALVSWCGVVGDVMLGLASGSPNLPIGTRASLYYRRYSGSARDPEREKLPKRSDTAGSTGSSNDHANSKKSFKLQKDKSRRSSVASGSGSTSTAHSRHTGKPLGIQDIAIMPSQRVPRYVLLFKDLLQQTPATSPSRALVERALEAATRIAKNCNDAQQHTALLPKA